MWADLLAAETQARSAPHEVTRRAELYLHAGLPLERVLDALRISRATWYRRLESLREWEAQNRAALRVVEERPRFTPEEERKGAEALALLTQVADERDEADMRKRGPEQ
jgi:hypothetical protein